MRTSLLAPDLMALILAASASLALANSAAQAQQKTSEKKVETPQKYILNLGNAEIKARQIALKASEPAAPVAAAAGTPTTGAQTPKTGAPSGDDGAPITPPPAPITAPQTPAPAAPPRDLPIESPPSQPNTQLENPNAIVPPAPLADINVVPPANIATNADGGALGSDQGLNVPLPNAATAGAAPNGTPDLSVPSTPETDVATGDEGANGNYNIVAPDGVVYDPETQRTVSRGKTTFSYRDFSVAGDRGIIDNKARRATIAGNLQVTARGQTFQGQSLTFDLDTGRWLLSSVAKTFPPELFPPGTVLEPLYIRDGRVLGQGDQGIGENFKFTSCDRDHYYIKSNRIEFYRDQNGQPRRLVARKNALYVFGRKILPLPVYVIGLVSGAGSRRSPVNATVGQNDVDGFFVRSFYDISATNRYTNSVLLDALQKRGLGVGLQQLDAAGGVLYAYLLSSKTGGRETNFRIQKNRDLNAILKVSTHLEATSNNSLTGPGVGAQNADITFTRSGTNAQSNLSFRTNSSDYGGGNNRAGSFSFDHQQNFGQGLNLTASAQINQSQSSFATQGASATTNDAATGDFNLALTKSTKLFDAQLRGELHPDLVNHRINQLERLPELTLQSDTKKLPIPVLANYLPGNFTIALGRFNEPRTIAGTNGQTQFSGLQKDRADIFYNANQKNYRLLGQGRSTSVFSASGNFDQAFYSDNFSRYNYTYNMNLLNTLGNLQLQANYFNSRTFGATPFQFDFFTPSENIDYTASYNLGQKLRLNLSGGSDLMNNYQRDLIFNAQFAPSKSFYGSLGTSYALENSNFGEIYGNFNIARNRRKFGGGELAFGLRYDPGGRGLTQANVSTDVNLGAKTRVQGLTSYNGFSKKFDFTQIRVIQDLHCFNLYVSYDNQRNQVRLDLALKAFPFADTRFGRNTQSEGFDSSVGIAR